MRIKLLLISVLALGFWFLAKTPSTYAQTTTPSTPLAGQAVATSTAQTNYLETNPGIPNDLHTYTQSVFIELASTVSCVLTGANPINPASRCLGIDTQTHKIGYVDNTGGGAIGMMGNLIGSTFYIPISTHQYADYAVSNFGVTKKTYAADDPTTNGGLGFNALLPTLTMWTAFRNITYMIFTLVFIVIGLGVMFRVKLDPKTAMTVQNQIPRIILALLFITFSYAIAGFMVDMMYVLIYLIIAIFAQQGYNVSSVLASNPFGAVGGIGGMSHIASGVSDSISGIVKDIFSGTLGTVVGAIIGGIIGKFIGGGAGSGFQLPFVGQAVTVAIGVIGGGLFGNKLVGYAAGIITYIVVIVAIFTALFKLWFSLIKCYLFVFLTVVFGPFYVAMGALPGQSGVGGWFKGMIANLSVFPVTITMFLLGGAFINAFTTGTAGNRPFGPPLVGDFVSPDKMASIIGLGIILLTPEVASMIRDALKVADLKQGASIGRSLQGGVGLVSAIPKSVGGEIFGMDKMGRPKYGTKWVTDRFGTALGGFFGGHGATHTPGSTTLPPVLARPLSNIISRGRASSAAGRGNRALNRWNGDEATRPRINGQPLIGPSQKSPPGWTPPPAGPAADGTPPAGGGGGGAGDGAPPAAGGGAGDGGAAGTAGHTGTDGAGGAGDDTTHTSGGAPTAFHASPAGTPPTETTTGPAATSHAAPAATPAAPAETPHKDEEEVGEKEELPHATTIIRSGGSDNKDDPRTEEEILKKITELSRITAKDEAERKRIEATMEELRKKFRRLKE